MITPIATLSYPHVFTPSVMKGETDMSKAKYSATLIFAPGLDLTALKEAVLEVATAKYGEETEAKIKSGWLRMPFRTDGAAKGYPEGSVYISARSKDKPVVVSEVPDPNNINPETGKGRPMLIEDERQIYAGCQVKGLLSVYAYDRSGNRGVTFGLEGLQKVADGERLDNRINPVNIFESNPDAAASFDLSDQQDETPPAKAGGSVLDLM